MLGVGSRKTSRKPSDRQKSLLHYFIIGVHVCQASTAYQRSDQCGKIITNTLLGTCDGSRNSQVVLTKGHFPTSTTINRWGPSPDVTIISKGSSSEHTGELSRGTPPQFFCAFAAIFQVEKWRPGGLWLDRELQINNSYGGKYDHVEYPNNALYRKGNPSKLPKICIV